MTDLTQTIAEIKARAEKAHPRPWSVGIYATDIWGPSAKGGDTKLFDIRGWGYLTGKGSGALGLEHDEAEQRQRDTGEFATSACNNILPIITELERLQANERRTQALYDAVSHFSVRQASRIHGQPLRTFDELFDWFKADVLERLVWRQAEIDRQAERALRAEREVERLQNSLTVIRDMPIPQQDNLLAANMRGIARHALTLPEDEVLS